MYLVVACVIKNLSTTRFSQQFSVFSDEKKIQKKIMLKFQVCINTTLDIHEHGSAVFVAFSKYLFNSGDEIKREKTAPSHL